MRKESLSFLSKLVETPSPSGFEGPVQEVWLKRTAPFAHSTRVDVHGNAIATLNPEGTPRVMLAGHCDEIGFMVKYISEEGYLSFAAIGGIDIHLVPARRVLIHSAEGPVPGVIGKKPIHLQDPATRATQKLEWHNLWIDIGVENRKEAEKLISLGDPITFTDGFSRLEGSLAVGRGFDDKMGSFVVSEVVRLLCDRKIKASVHAVSTVQEELGLRGAKTSAYGIDPDVGIAVDVTFASDYPEMDKKQVGDIKLGKGPVIARGANINPKVFTGLVETARAKKIPYQVDPSPRATGTDASVIQLTRSGVAAALVSVPNRYMHTPVETICLKDLENAARLLAAFIESLKPGQDFIPFGKK
ncbi:MAG: M42 family metallopeptidase [bacterium]|nr:MAG: M42 family metallopeptidase [bacterium]